MDLVMDQTLLQLERGKDNVNTQNRILANFFGEFALTDWVKFKSSYSIDASTGAGENFGFPTWENREVNQTNFFAENQRNGFNWIWTNSLQFSKTINDKHVIGALVGYESGENKSRQIQSRVDGFDFTSNDIRYINTSLATFNSTASFLNYWSTWTSIFGKIDYSYNDRYIFSATVRRDGSSNFGTEKYGVFPAFSVGWRISEEGFLNGVSWIDDLKLRAGYGVTGNSNTPTSNAYDQWGARSPFDASYDIGGTNTAANAGFTQTNIGNINTSWEENKTTNFGIDATLFDGKLTAVIDVYKKEIDGLLFQAPFPGTAGNAQVPSQNVAAMTNTGWDLGLNYSNFITTDIKLNLGMNLSSYKNEITSLDGNALNLFPGGIDGRFGTVNAWPVGSPISSFWGLQVDGIFQNAAEAAALDQPGAAPGRYRFKDLNGDGQINDDDKGIIGNPHPKATLGFNIGLDVKNFDFNVFFFGSFGNEIYNYNRLFTHFGFFNTNVANEALDNAWTGEGSGGTLPAVDGNDSFSLDSNTSYVEPGGYLRMQNLSVGYTFPANNVFSNLRIYIQGQNLFTITNYGGIDPALSNVNIGDGRQNDGWTGYDFGNFPTSKIVSIGVNASF
jgi:TonB-linked SusC/RagA family outer membrane protein